MNSAINDFRIILFDVPSREVNGSIPFGVLAAANIARKAGYPVQVHDLTMNKLTTEQVIDITRQYNPALIGFGGITPSYRHLKPLALALKKEFPETPFVAGGIITSVTDLLLTKAGIDICVRGEADYSFPDLLECLRTGKDFRNVPGISFLENGQIIDTPRPTQVKNLDEIGMPPYDMVNISQYITPTSQWVEAYREFLEMHWSGKDIEELAEKYPKIFAMMTSRGCTHACSFCYRHVKGVRQQSVEFVLNHMQYLRDAFDINLFYIGDELTTVTKKWIMHFCAEIKRRNMDIRYVVLSARSCNVDEEMLNALKSSGCLMINYGYESGSDIVLKGTSKGTTRQDNINAGLLTLKCGLTNVPEMIIGFPEETDETINDSINFIKQLGVPSFSLNFPIPFPETPLWDYCMANNLIADKEQFLLNLGNASVLRVNLTKHSDAWLNRSMVRFKRDVIVSYQWKKGNYLKAILLWLQHTVSMQLSKELKTKIRVLFRF